MSYIVVRNEDGIVLSRTEPYGPIAWLDIGVSKATDYRYAITFDTFSGADKCAQMQGGRATRLDDSRVAVVGVVDDTAYRVAHNWGLGLVEVEQ